MTAPDFHGASWRKSSHSQANTNCVELAFVSADWRKSSYSQANTDCVELATSAGQVGVRDSKNATGPVLAFPADTWSTFAARLV